jgi:hypothetical protein
VTRFAKPDFARPSWPETAIVVVTADRRKIYERAITRFRSALSTRTMRTPTTPNTGSRSASSVTDAPTNTLDSGHWIEGQPVDAATARIFDLIGGSLPWRFIIKADSSEITEMQWTTSPRGVVIHTRRKPDSHQVTITINPSRS